MATYLFRNTLTDEEYSLFMSMNELDEYLAANQFVEQLPPSEMTLGDAVRMNITKPPIEFRRDVLGRVKKNMPGAQTAAMERRWSIPKGM